MMHLDPAASLVDHQAGHHQAGPMDHCSSHHQLEGLEEHGSSIASMDKLDLCGAIISEPMDNSDQNTEDGTDSGLEDADMGNGPDGLDMIDSCISDDLPPSDHGDDGELLK